MFSQRKFNLCSLHGKKNGTHIKYYHAKSFSDFLSINEKRVSRFYSDWFLDNETEESGKDTLWVLLILKTDSKITWNNSSEVKFYWTSNS